jgi:hypothetical protein
MYATVVTRSGACSYFYGAGQELYDTRVDERDSIAILEREALVETRRLMIAVRGYSHDVEVGLFQATRFGVEFVRDCSPDGSQRAKRRAAELRKSFETAKD